MFKFDFDFDFDAEEGEDNNAHFLEITRRTEPENADDRPLVEHGLSELLNKLPDEISYSPVRTGNLCIPRRDLFDVRMQLIVSDGSKLTNDDDDESAQIDFASRPSDLVPRLYEGGLKTWECSLDLAEYVHQSEDVRGKSVLELGCGTAMPSLAVLQSLMDGELPKDDGPETVVHFQDYNASVLEYVTLPNVILVWFFSQAGAAFRNTLPPPSPKQSPLPELTNLSLEPVPEEGEEEDEHQDDKRHKNSPSIAPPASHFDPTAPGDLSLSQSLQSAFTDSLGKYKIKLRFLSGPWDKLYPHLQTQYNLILTSETIYQPTSLSPLVRLLRDVTGLGDAVICLVAAKVVYFGVGGGVKEFERALGEIGGRMDSVWENREGVRRSILRVRFD